MGESCSLVWPYFLKIFFLSFLVVVLKGAQRTTPHLCRFVMGHNTVI